MTASGQDHSAAAGGGSGGGPTSTAVAKKAMQLYRLQDRDGDTALHLAARTGRHAACAVLCQVAGAAKVLAAPNKNGRTPIDLAWLEGVAKPQGQGGARDQGREAGAVAALPPCRAGCQQLNAG